MKIIGITGPTGAGKTTALNVLRTLGAEVIDADAVYHGLLEGDKTLREALVSAFGAQILDEAGKIDRKKLSDAVYPDRLEELNAITHPVIVRAVWEKAEEAKRAGRSAAVDAAALIESGLGEKCDAVVAILAPLETRIRRIMARDGITEEYARRRALAQPSEEFYCAHSDYVLENRESDTPETFAARVETLFSALLFQRAGKAAEDVSFHTKCGRFNYRVCAVMVRRGKLLAMHDEVSPYYYLPGGRVKLHERAEDALVREVREELGVEAKIVRPLWLNQAFFTEDVKKEKFHELCLYFLTEAGGLPEESFTRREGKHTHVFEWLPFERLKDEYLYPVFIKEAVFDLPESLKLQTEYE